MSNLNDRYRLRQCHSGDRSGYRKPDVAEAAVPALIPRSQRDEIGRRIATAISATMRVRPPAAGIDRNRPLADVSRLWSVAL